MRPSLSGIKCELCGGTKDTGCICIATARELFPDIIAKQYGDESTPDLIEKSEDVG